MHWVFIRGLARSAAHWGTFPRQFASQLDASVSTIDLPGFGEFIDLPSPVSIAAIAAHVRQQIEARVPGHQQLALVGISLGGMVATEVAVLLPHRVTSMVLINTSTRCYGHICERLRPRAYPAIVKALTTISMSEREPVIYTLTSRRPELREKTVSTWRQIHQQTPCKQRNVARQLLAASNYRGRAIAPCQQILLLASARDGLVHPSCSTRMAAAWQMPCQVHPTAGHDLPHDEPEWVLNRIARWLQG